MRTPPPEPPHPDEVRAVLASAQNHATDEVLTLKRKQRKWILVGVGAYIITLVGLAVAVFLLYQQGHQIVDQGHKIVDQGNKIVDLQNAQAESAKTGRALLKQVQDQTDPNSQASKDQQARIGVILGQLDEAQRQGRADQLKKIAQMFEQCRALPCDPAVVNRILAQPVPVPTFGAAPAAPAPASPASAKPASTSGAGVGTAAAPKACPGPIVIQATPLTLPLLPPANVNVCIPAPPKP